MGRLIDKVSLIGFQLLASASIVFTSGQVGPNGQVGPYDTGRHGQVDPYIIGGDDAKFKTHPWMVSIYFGCFGSCQPDDRCTYLRCGGTLISPDWVLTAAHCFEGTYDNLNYFQVNVGDYDFLEYDRHEVQLAVKEIKQHKDYIHTTTRVENDIALIKLNQSVVEFPETKCLRIADNKDSLMDDCHLFGWGEARQDNTTDCKKSHTLKHVNLNMVDLDTCSGYYPNHTLYDRNVCAGGEKGQGACFGDSGGGLYCPTGTSESDTWELLGIASWTMTSPCASLHKPTVFTDATKFRSWINENCENCLEDYNDDKCRNPVELYPVIPTTTTAPPTCEYPIDPSNGHYICSNSEVGGPVGVGEDCTLHCYNRMGGGYKTCQHNGQYNEDQLTEAKCSESTSYCSYPIDPQDGHFQCLANQDGTVSSGQVCIFRCYNGHYGGTMQCRSDQSYDETDLVRCESSNHQCPYPPDPPNGHFLCPTSSQGGMVDSGGVCVLPCYNGQFGNYITCKGNGHYDYSNLMEYKCNGSLPLITTPEPTTTRPPTTQAAGCPYPNSLVGTYNCPGVEPESLVDIGGQCYLICTNGQFAGSIVCMSNGQFDESGIDEDICTVTEKPTSTTTVTEKPTSTTTSSADCQKEALRYWSHDIYEINGVGTWMECGFLCQDEDECTHWTWNSESKICWIKRGDFGDGLWAPGYISGDDHCPQ